MTSTTSLGSVCDIASMYSLSQSSIPHIKHAFDGKLAYPIPKTQDDGTSPQRLNAFTASHSTSSSNNVPISVSKIQSLLLETPSYCALMDSNSATSFPERRLDGEDDSYEEHLHYLLTRSAQLLKHRQDEDLFQHRKDPFPPVADDDSSGSDSSSQAEYGSQGSLSQESDPELETVLATYCAIPRTVASLVTLPSLQKAIVAGEPLSPQDSWPTIPSESSKSLSLMSLASVEEAHKMIWQLEEIAAGLRAIDSSSVYSNSLARMPSSVSSLPAPPMPTIPLPALPSTPSPLSDSRLLPSPWSMNSFSRASNLSATSTVHSLAYLKARESSATVFGQEQSQHVLLDHEDASVPQIIVTEPSEDKIPGAHQGQMLVKDATLLMDLVEDCYGDHWDPDRTLLYRTQTMAIKVPEGTAGAPTANGTRSAGRVKVKFTQERHPRAKATSKRWYQRLAFWGPGTSERNNNNGTRRPSVSQPMRHGTPPRRRIPKTKTKSKPWYRCIFPEIPQHSTSRPRSSSTTRTAAAPHYTQTPTGPGPRPRPRPPISRPTPVVDRKSWPARSVDPARVRQSMGAPVSSSSSKKRTKGTRRGVLLGKPVESPVKKGGWAKVKGVFR
ncbi:hypothetical protein BXZ70DRAFT_676889 [Cristinia sonorae]|uniref:Uncharacterized protein n=1 Tax=Cristinia sonorae TaxID=1940300 RepID=A0A8K0UTT0_9AGAR|nr:hypothetical protein BXZ70DRAFT_676889 [Cristinia sonorae]